MIKRVVTIGIYGFQAESFFASLISSGVDTFLDIRRRRGVRGSLYAFANSIRLQQRLKQLHISYIYAPELAPTKELRERQRMQDHRLGESKRARTRLSPEFIRGFEEDCLAQFQATDLMGRLRSDAQVLALCCVEQDAMACHRSLVATRLSVDLNIPVEHLRS